MANTLTEADKQLISAIRLDDAAGVHKALGQGAKLDVIVDSDRTPLMLAAWEANEHMVEVLLQAGANPNWPPATGTVDGPRGFLPLHRVAVTGETGIAKRLIHAGADVNGQVRAGGTALWYAIANENIGIASALIGAGADVDAGFIHEKPVFGGTGPVIFKVEFPTKEHLLRLLLDGGADLQKRNERGQTYSEFLQDSMHDKEPLTSIVQEYERYPSFDPAMLKDMHKVDLFASNEHGYCLLGSPTTWRHFDAICTALEGKGEALTAEDYLQETSSGKSWLQRGSECFATAAVFEGFAKAGGDVKAQLLDAKQQPTALMELLCERQQIAQVMRADTWRRQPNARNAIRDICDALPYESRDDVRNYYQLVTALQQQAMPERGR
jgi:hypothetical protein